MSELLLELFSEEIPARMQVRAASDLKRLVSDGLKTRGLDCGGARSYSTPRRLTIVIDDVADQSLATSDEKKGPRIGAPDQAVQGFLKSAGLSSIEDATVVTDAKKGDYYVARIEKPGRPATLIVADTIIEAISKFPWPKAMRWGSSPFQWVRPLKSILCVLDGEIVPFDVGGITSGNTTRGHRFHANEPFVVSSFGAYMKALEARHVIFDPGDRATRIAEQARDLAKAAHLQLVEDEALLNENAGLTEWPVVHAGTFDEAFLEVPGEVLTTSMKMHQKCFSLRHARTKKLANRFVMVANLDAADGGTAIIAGNEKVIRARLSDAKFFWDQDLKRPLGEMAGELAGITFHEKLGSQKDRVERIEQLAFELAGACDAVPEDARRAAGLAKADLVSGMVGEFPELQGLMGRYYAEHVGVKPEIARAIELHYKPKGPTDSVPLAAEGNAVACAVALADKLDTLIGFWSIGEKPTGSGDPYQLRRAALGVIRIVLENDFRLPLMRTLARAHDTVLNAISETKIADKKAQGGRSSHAAGRAVMDWGGQSVPTASVDLLAFFADRLKVFLREQGQRHDLIDAIFALPGQDDLAILVKRVAALDDLLKSEDGGNLLAGVKRAANILGIEEKKNQQPIVGAPNQSLMSEPEELALGDAIQSVTPDIAKALEVENFAGAMRALSELRAPIDAFFEKVLVNADDPGIRTNRLRLLAQIRASTLNIADFSKISG